MPTTISDLHRSPAGRPRRLVPATGKFHRQQLELDPCRGAHLARPRGCRDRGCGRPVGRLAAFKVGEPGPDELLLRLPVARLAVDLAGRRGGAGVAATAQTDFGIRRNGTSFATMRFAAAADTAAFIAASETVLEPGDVLGVVAPAMPDASLAEIGFVLTETLAY